MLGDGRKPARAAATRAEWPLDAASNQRGHARTGAPSMKSPRWKVGRWILAALALAPLGAFAACSSSSPANDSQPTGSDDGDGARGDEDVARPDDASSDVTDADAGHSALVPPAPAAAAGFTKLVFDQGGSAGWNIDLGQTNQAGHAWYSSGGFFGASGAATQVGDGGVLTIASGSMATATRLGTDADAGYVGHAFGGGFYVEASLALSPGCGQNGIVSAFWGLPVEKEEAPSRSDQWPGQPSGYVHYVELDFMEFHLAPARPPSTSYYALDWYGEFVGDTPTCIHTGGAVGFCHCANNGSCPAAPANGADDLPDATDFAAFNVYGALVVPAQDKTPDSGYSQGFFDGKKTPSALRWDPYDAAIGPPPDKAQVFAVTDIEHFYLIANTTAGCPMQMAYVRVWQRP